MKKIIQIAASSIGGGGLFALTEDGGILLGTTKGVFIHWRSMESKMLDVTQDRGIPVADRIAKEDEARKAVKAEDKAGERKHSGGARHS